MGKRGIIIAILLACVGVWLSPSPAAAGFKAGGGYLDLKVDGTLKLDPLEIAWIWEPYFDNPFSLDVFARCERVDQAGNGTGKNKVFFKNLEISSLVSSKVAVFKKQKAKMKDGDTGWQAWDALFMEPLHADGPALAIVTVQVKGKLKAGDRLTCRIDVNEGVFGFSGAPASAEERTPVGPVGTGRLIEKQ